jgi:hypothetical protein
MTSGQLGEIDWLPESQEDYRADPFLRRGHGTLSICYESYSYWRARGRIAELMVSTAGSHPSIVARAIVKLSIRGHLSYPYVIHWKGVEYVLLENVAEYRVPLYGIDAAGRYRYIADLLHGDSFVDTSWVFHAGWHYLFTTRREEPRRLLIFMSQELTGPYVTHPSSGHLQAGLGETHRGGGTVFQWKDKWFRSTQNDDGGYGKSLTVRRITQLAPHRYAEAIHAKLRPIEPYGDGLHTLSVCGERAVVDGRRLKRSAFAPLKMICQRIRAPTPRRPLSPPTTGNGGQGGVVVGAMCTQCAVQRADQRES